MLEVHLCAKLQQKSTTIERNALEHKQNFYCHNGKGSKLGIKLISLHTKRKASAWRPVPHFEATISEPMSSKGRINFGCPKSPTTGSPNVIVALVIHKLSPVTSNYNKTDFQKSSRNSWLLLLSLRMGASPGVTMKHYICICENLCSCFCYNKKKKKNNNGVQEEYHKGNSLSQKTKNKNQNKHFSC